MTVADIIAYRLAHERLVERVEEPLHRRDLERSRRQLPRSSTPRSTWPLVLGDVASSEPTLVRVHDQCLTGDVFGSLRCDCGEQLEAAMQRIADEDAA
ncbi:MAG: hypothetical protein U0360_10310 [Dehalococcoidia bacterium]